MGYSLHGDWAKSWAMALALKKCNKGWLDDQWIFSNSGTTKTLYVMDVSGRSTDTWPTKISTTDPGYLSKDWDFPCLETYQDCIQIHLGSIGIIAAVALIHCEVLKHRFRVIFVFCSSQLYFRQRLYGPKVSWDWARLHLTHQSTSSNDLAENFKGT